MKIPLTVAAGLFVACGSARPLEARAEDQRISELRAYVVTALPVVEAFEAALENSDSSEIARLSTSDFHVTDRSDREVRLGIEALLDYIEGCETPGRMSANTASITITHVCDGYDYREVLYNVKDGKVSRVVIGSIPSLEIRPRD